ncbi:MAG: patatin-like phospholipase family protein [Peptococcaceae bacterium]|nr:patatin-like phospholipase family protein [Peptococcaceae bacterium]MDH7524132.1 patatin-like phospholipase family protein [Peptococcaceae bacterium]
MTLGLVFSGGGVRGGAHIGVLLALHEEKIFPGMIAGTSAGSIIAGLYAYGYSPEEIRLIARKIGSNCFDVDYKGILKTMVSLFCRGNILISGLIHGDLLECMFFRLTKGARLKDAKIPVAITAVDINNTHLVIFTNCNTRFMRQEDCVYLTGNTIAEAIRASISIPGIFKPKMIDKMRLVDGGVRANLPVEAIKRMGARKVIAVNLGYSGYPVPGVDDILEISLQSIDLMIYQITRPSLAMADVVITPSFCDVKHSDMSKIDYLIECGYRATKSEIPRIKQLLAR